MRSKKRYTNVTFTKRVDHEEGHHPKIAPPESSVCETCGAVYADKRWVSAEASQRLREEGGKHHNFRPALPTTCPACKQIRHGEPSGFVHVVGEFVSAHAEDIQRLLRNEGERALEDNPLARIMELTTSGERIEVSTTTEHLAQRLGHALEKAYGGIVDYDFSHENKLARVTWKRD